MKDSTAAIEREAPVIDDAEPTGPLMMTKVDPAAEMAKFDAANQLLAKLVPATIKATKPQDWLKMGDKVYLQATGLERIAPLWGLCFSEPKIVREDYPDNTFGYGVSGWVRSRFGVSHHVGGRSSADPFFDSFDEEKPSGWRDMQPGERAEWKAKHRLPPDPMEVRKAAVTNWMVRAGSMICGLRGLTLADLQAQKIDGVAAVEYGKGQKGGATATSDLTARRTALWNDILKRTSGDADAAHSLLKDITKYDAYKNKKTGKDVPANPGAANTDSLSEYALQIAEGKVSKHPVFGDEAQAQREPGEEG
jgi:hypothetical protein